MPWLGESSTDKLRDTLIVRDNDDPNRGPLPLCRVTFRNVVPGECFQVFAWTNITNDSADAMNIGYSMELHRCSSQLDPECERFDKIDMPAGSAALAQNGGANIDRRRHHEPQFRYGRLVVTQAIAVMRIEIQGRAYNLNASGSRNKLTIDAVGLDVERR
jgi:hypothetical protein